MLVVALVLVIAGIAWVGASKVSADRALAEEQARIAAAEMEAARQRQEALAAERLREERELAERQQARERQQAIEKALADLQTQQRRWADASALASSTGRIALAGPVATLQTLHRETELLVVPPCLDRAKESLVSGMASEVEGFMIFMRNTGGLGEELARIDFVAAREAFGRFEMALSECDDFMETR